LEGDSAVRPLTAERKTYMRNLPRRRRSSLFECSPRRRRSPVLRQNSVRGQGVDRSTLMRRQSPPHGQHPAPPASTPRVPLRWPPPTRSGEPRLAPPAGRLQDDGEPSEVAQQRSALLDRAFQGVGRLEADPRHRGARHRAAVEAATLPPALDLALRPAPGGRAPVNAEVRAPAPAKTIPPRDSSPAQRTRAPPPAARPA
jgi:hypothetical protein